MTQAPSNVASVGCILLFILNNVPGNFIMIYPFANFNGSYLLFTTTQPQGEANIGSVIVKGRYVYGQKVHNKRAKLKSLLYYSL